MNKLLTGLVLAAAGVNGAYAATLDFTISTSGFVVETYNVVAGTNIVPGVTFNSGNIVQEAGFANILLDVNGENLDIFIDDVGSGNPYFDKDSGGPPVASDPVESWVPMLSATLAVEIT